MRQDQLPATPLLLCAARRRQLAPGLARALHREHPTIVRLEQHPVVRSTDDAEAIDPGPRRQGDLRHALGGGVESGERKAAARLRHVGEEVDTCGRVNEIIDARTLTQRRDVNDFVDTPTGVYLLA